MELNTFSIFFNEYGGLLPFIFMFIFGSIIGSFLNVVIYRIPLSLNIEFIKDLKNNNIKTNEEIESFYKKNKMISIFSHSKCPSCKTKIKPWFNIPIIGFFLSKCICFSCKQRISLQYPLIETINAIAYTAIYILSEKLYLEEILLMISFSMLLGMIMIDIKEQILPDILIYPFLFIGMFLSLENGEDYKNIFLNLLVVSLSLYSFVYYYQKLRKLDFLIGFGDIKLFIACTAWIGLQGILHVILMSSIIGILLGLLMRKKEIPFGPSIIISFILLYIFNIY